MSVIQGRVVDGQGRPAAQAAVYVVSAPVALPDVAMLTGADGRFVLSVTAAGAYTLGARGHGGQASPITLEARGQPVIEVELRLMP